MNFVASVAAFLLASYLRGRSIFAPFKRTQHFFKENAMVFFSLSLFLPRFPRERERERRFTFDERKSKTINLLSCLEAHEMGIISTTWEQNVDGDVG